jgi:hypothetical protein
VYKKFCFCDNVVDPDPGFDDQKLKKIQLEQNLSFLWSKLQLIDP